MDNLIEIKKEYHRLILTLNSTNKIHNQKTEMVFEIKTTRDKTSHLMATVNFEKYLNFGKINNNFRLAIDQYLEFQNFAQYIKDSISGLESEDQLNSTIRLAIRKLFTAE